MARPECRHPRTVVSLFDGIGGFPQAFASTGDRTVLTVEIDPAAAGVTCDRFPDATHLRDVTEVTVDDILRAGFCPLCGVVCAGWPCQDLSLAGRRLGLGGARSGLFWEIVRIARGVRPRWLVLENVPGLLSAVCSCPGLGVCGSGCTDPHAVRGGACGSGRCMELHGGAMGAVLGALAELGYGFAYRVLDAQHFGVPQRRRRVVIVGCLGDGAAPAQVLLEPEGCAGDPAARGEAGASSVGSADGRPGRAGGQVVNALTRNGVGGGGGPDDNAAQGGHLIASPIKAANHHGDQVGTESHLIASPLTAREGKGPDSDATNGNIVVGPVQTETGRRADVDGAAAGSLIAPALTAEGSDASEDDTGRGAPLVTHTLTSGDGSATEDGRGRVNPIVPVLADTVRRLTPVECERLQGYPDGWTATSNGRPQSDAARYRQLGNSIAVPVFAWVAARVAAYDSTADTLDT